MNKRQTLKMRNALTVLTGQPLRSVFRCMDMICFEFGEIITKRMFGRDAAGKPSLVNGEAGRYALHILRNFRISAGSEILLTRNDVYQPNSMLANSMEDDDDEFDWSPNGNNRCDELVKQHFSEPIDTFVDRISTSMLGDLTIRFKNGIILEVFPDVSDSEECWRFFEAGADEHLIVNGLGIAEDEAL